MEEKLEAFVKLSKIITEANGDFDIKYNHYNYGDFKYYAPAFHCGYITDYKFSLWCIMEIGDANIEVPSTLLLKSKELAKKIAEENIELYEILYGYSDADSDDINEDY